MSHPALAFHHVGVACTNVEAELARWTSLGYVPEGEPFEDPIQGVRGMFLSGQAPRLELLAPLGSGQGGVLTPWLQGEIKLYHLAYETDSLMDAIAHMRRERAKLVVPPVPAVAYTGRAIAFMMMRNRLLIELIARDVS